MCPFFTGVDGAVDGQGSMGNRESVFTQEQLEEYQDCTFFTKKEILHIHKRFRSLCQAHHGEDVRLPVADILQLPELRVNPFRNRIVQVCPHAQ